MELVSCVVIMLVVSCVSQISLANSRCLYDTLFLYELLGIDKYNFMWITYLLSLSNVKET